MPNVVLLPGPYEHRTLTVNDRPNSGVYAQFRVMVMRLESVVSVLVEY